MRKNPKHLEFIRSLPCCICGCPDTQACHVRTGTDGGMGLKPSDKFTVPMDAVCHNLQHCIGENAFWGDRNPKQLAESLYEISGDFQAGLKLIIQFRNK